VPRVRQLHDDKTIAVRNRVAAAKAAGLVEKLLDRADELREQGDDKNCSFATRAAQAAAITGGVSYDKSRLAEERPTVIHSGEHRDADQLIASLRTLGVIIDSDAVEIGNQAELPPAA
jgi:hypothetical protein